MRFNIDPEMLKKRLTEQGVDLDALKLQVGLGETAEQAIQRESPEKAEAWEQAKQIHSEELARAQQDAAAEPAPVPAPMPAPALAPTPLPVERQAPVVPQEKISAFYAHGQRQALEALGLHKFAGWFSNLWGQDNKQTTAKATSTTGYGSRPPGAPAPGQTPSAPKPLTVGGRTNQRETLRREGVFGM